MPTGQQLIDWCVAQRGKPYSWEGRFGPYYFDCSGLVTAACWAHGLSPSGQNSTGLELWARNEGLGLDLFYAMHTPGALVYVWGYGANGHVAMSLGDGEHIVETPSAEGHCVGISPFWRSNWTGASLIPGVDHFGAGAPQVPGGEPVLQVGSMGPLVGDWQMFLGIAIDGEFGAQTKAAVEAFQQLFGLEVDGIIGQQTWDTRRFVESNNNPSPTPPPPAVETPPPGGDPVLQRGSMGPAVGDWQQYLGITVDGEFGPDTEKAVKDWQTFFQIEADGVIGPESWQLRRFLESLPPTPPPDPLPPVVEIPPPVVPPPDPDPVDPPDPGPGPSPDPDPGPTVSRREIYNRIELAEERILDALE